MTRYRNIGDDCEASVSVNGRTAIVTVTSPDGWSHTRNLDAKPYYVRTGLFARATVTPRPLEEQIREALVEMKAEALEDWAQRVRVGELTERVLDEAFPTSDVE